MIMPKTSEKQECVGGEQAGIKTYYKTLVIKTVRSLHMDSWADQWNRVGNSEVDPSTQKDLVNDGGGISDPWEGNRLIHRLGPDN